MSDDVSLHLGDCLRWMKSIDINYKPVQMVFADPPFGVGFNYGKGEYDDKKFSKSEYVKWSRRWMKAAERILAPTGTFWIAIGDEFAAELCLIAKDIGLTMRNWCVWHYTFGPHLTSKFGRNKAHLLYFVKDPDNFTFNPESIRIESERQRIGDKRADPRGRVPGDVWEVPRLPGNAKERTGHPCQMPEEILRRIVLATTDAGDLVVDPFGGSFVTAAVCRGLGRRCISGDVSPKFCKAGQLRLRTVTPATLFTEAV